MNKLLTGHYYLDMLGNVLEIIQFRPAEDCYVVKVLNAHRHAPLQRWYGNPSDVKDLGKKTKLAQVLYSNEVSLT